MLETPRVSSNESQGLVVQVRKETPFLPKVAFVVITLASMLGAVFTGRSLGVDGVGVAVRWFAIWVTAMTFGFTAWRVVYLRAGETGLDPSVVAKMAASAVEQASRIRRMLAIALIPAVVVPFILGYMNGYRSWVLALLAGAMVVLMARKSSSVGFDGVGLVVAGSALVVWGFASTAGGAALVRSVHLLAFGLWIGGALWNLTVAIPTGRKFPVVDAVVAEARQLQRFRWVVRFSLPAIIVTGLVQSDVYRQLPMDWWMSFPGVLIPLKMLFIVALVVIFITCPLYRQCSPVVGVCNVEDTGLPPKRLS